jgi:hypothetical protein
LLTVSFPHDYDSATLNRLAIDVHLVAGFNVIGKRFEAAFAFSAQFIFVMVHHLAALTYGVGKVSAFASGPTGDRLRHLQRRNLRGCLLYLLLGVSGPSNPGDNSASKPSNSFHHALRLLR